MVSKNTKKKKTYLKRQKSCNKQQIKTRKSTRAQRLKKKLAEQKGGAETATKFYFKQIPSMVEQSEAFKKAQSEAMENAKKVRMGTMVTKSKTRPSTRPSTFQWSFSDLTELLTEKNLRDMCAFVAEEYECLAFEPSTYCNFTGP